MTNGQRVLVVDGLAETEEVLKAILEPQGLEVNRIRTQFAQDTPAAQSPHLVILHENSSSSPDAWPNVPKVVIGSISVSRSQALRERPSESRAQYLCQPFHYRDLIQAVEHLLSDS